MMAVPVVVTNSNTMSYNMHTFPPPKEQTLHQTSDHPHAVIDYSQFMSGNEEDTSPPLEEVYSRLEANSQQFKDSISKLSYQTI